MITIDDISTVICIGCVRFHLKMIKSAKKHEFILPRDEIYENVITSGLECVGLLLLKELFVKS